MAGRGAWAVAAALLLLASWVLVQRRAPASVQRRAPELHVSQLSAAALREAWRAQGVEPSDREVEGVLAEAGALLASPVQRASSSGRVALFARPPGMHWANARAAASPVPRPVPHALVAPSGPFMRHPTRTATAKSCICVNCKWVEKCTAYHFVEEQHEVPHLNEAPKFEPVNTSIQVFLRTEEIGLTQEFDVFDCDSFFLEQGTWKKLRPGEEIPT